MGAQRVCVLSDEEVGRLKNYDLTPCCHQHKHIAITSALRKIKLSQVDLVEHRDQQYVTLAKLHVLQSRKSAGVIRTIQRVRGNPLKRIIPPTMLELD